MPEEKEENVAEKEGLGTITRREFTIGSIALIGTYASNEVLGQDAPSPIKLEKSNVVEKLLEERHILDEDLIQVIQHAEKTGEKLYQPEMDGFLSKLRIKNVYFYVEYAVISGGYRIYTAYSHRFAVEGDD
jgi:glutamate synthase (NADPH) small chain